MDSHGQWVVGRVHTGRRVVESILVENGRVIAAGSRRATRRSRSTGAERTEVRGAIVVPGMLDAHVHPVHMALEEAGVDLSGVGSIEEIVERSRRWASQHPTGAIVGRGWDQERFSERRYPTARDLDRISTDRSVVLLRTCSHAAALNQAALAALDVTRTTPDPPGGRIGREARREPNGLLFENALLPALSLVERAVFDWPGVLERTVEQALRVGLTTIASMNASLAEVRWGFEGATASRSRPRLRYYVPLRDLEALERLPPSRRPERARVTGVKAVLDGSFGSRTARLREPYTDRAGELGVALWDPEALTERTAAAEALGWHVALHAIGDAALADCLTMLESHPEVRRVRLEHAALTPPELLNRLGRLRPDIVVQPGFVASDSWIVQRLGVARARWTYAFRSLLDRSIRVAGSSDAPVEPLDPLNGMRAAVERAPFRAQLDAEGSRAHLSPAEALRLYTSAPAEVLGEPPLGSLEVGSVADWTVLRGTTIDSAVSGVRPSVLETWVDGDCQFRRSDR